MKEEKNRRKNDSVVRDYANEKVIVITDENVMTHGYDDTDELLSVLISSVVEVFSDVNGEVNEISTGKRIIDVLYDALTAARVDALYRMISEERDGEA